MDKKTILVTGSTGWLGGKLCEALVARGVNVVGLARRKTEIDGLRGCVMADLSTGEGLEFLSRRASEIDCCVHLAAVAGWGELGDCLEVNVQGTRRLFDALAGACTRFVVASSISTVGTGRPNYPPQQLPMPDTHPYVGYPWAYALSKWQMEQLVQFIATKNNCENPDAPLDITMLRIGCCLTDPGEGPPRHLETGIAAADTAKLRITHKERNQWGCDGYRCVEYALVSESFLCEANGAVMCAGAGGGTVATQAA